MPNSDPEYRVVVSYQRELYLQQRPCSLQVSSIGPHWFLTLKTSRCFLYPQEYQERNIEHGNSKKGNSKLGTYFNKTRVHLDDEKVPLEVYCRLRKGVYWKNLTFDGLCRFYRHKTKQHCIESMRKADPSIVSMQRVRSRYTDLQVMLRKLTGLLANPSENI